MIRTYADAINRIAERTVDNQRQLKKDTTQRRDSFVDLYGVEYLRQGDASHPATFYINISPDFQYFERFALKLQIMPFASTVKGIDLPAETEEESLSISGSTITPNPHKHALLAGTATADYGLQFITTTSTNWRIKIHGVDCTPYFMAQQDGAWIEGEGIYPTNRNEDITDYYDVLAAACDMRAEGNTSDANKLLVPEMKKVEIVSDAPFQVATMVYVKASIVNR